LPSACDKFRKCRFDAPACDIGEPRKALHVPDDMGQPFGGSVSRRSCDHRQASEQLVVAEGIRRAALEASLLG
jgi:hypothetical protein